MWADRDEWMGALISLPCSTIVSICLRLPGWRCTGSRKWVSSRAESFTSLVRPKSGAMGVDSIDEGMT